jgi:ubiquinone/menaquinone biosynthesis C-methylase UbiE
MVRNLASRLLPFRVKQALRQWLRGEVPASLGYEVIAGAISPQLLRGWKDKTVAKRQHAAFSSLLAMMRAGKPREDFVALVTAVQLTGVDNPLIIEVGCGSGWNSEVLAYLLKRPIRYIGLDYSLAMTTSGKQCYPGAQFIVADASMLPFQSGTCDILLSGGVLMHLIGYQQAIQESQRVTRRWCILHTIPLVKQRPTTVIRKLAYGSPVVEVVFNIEEFLQLMEASDLVPRQVLENIPHEYLDRLMGEPVAVRTYLCEVGAARYGN